MLMGVHCITLLVLLGCGGMGSGESHISILLTDAYGDSEWVGIKSEIAYGCLR